MSEDKSEKRSLPGRFFSAVGRTAGKLFHSAEHAAGTTGRRAALAFASVGQSPPEFALEEIATSLAGWFELKSRGETELSREKPSTVDLQAENRRNSFSLNFTEPGFLGKTYRFMFEELATPKLLERAAAKVKGVSQTLLLVRQWPPDLFQEPEVPTFVWNHAAQLGPKGKAGDFVGMWLVDFVGFRFRHLDLVEKTRQKAPDGLFLGRTREVTVFEELLEGDPEQARVVSVTAQGGSGKSYFLKRLSELYAPRLLFARVDHQSLKFENDSVSGLANLFKDLAAELDKRGCSTPEFDKAFAGYLRSSESGDGEPRGFTGAIKRTVQTMGAINPILAAVGAGIDLVANWSSELQEESEALAHDAIIRTLTRALIEDLQSFVDQQRKRYMLWRRPVLAFDTYEILALVVDPWLRTELLTREDFRSLGAVVMVAGRHPLLQVNTRWAEHQEFLRHLHLKPFSEEEANAYLERLGVEPERRPDLIEMAQGYPLFLNLAAHSSSRGSALQALATRVLEETQEADREVFLVASVGQSFDRERLGRALERDLDEETWKRTVAATFVESEGGRWRISEPARGVLEGVLELESPERAQRIREALA